MRIGLDVDGVLYHFTHAYNTKLQSLGHEFDDLFVEPDTWDYFTKYGYTTEEFLAHLDEMVDNKQLFWQGELYEEDIPEWIDKLRDEGHTIHFVTNRFSGKSECAEEATRHFFDSRGIHYDTLTFSSDKTVVETDVFLEDNLKNFEKIWAANRVCYLVNRPYNQTGEDEAFRVDTFSEFARMFLPGGWWHLAARYAKSRERQLSR
jgi:uncharacterized HAD superfamily protein